MLKENDLVLCTVKSIEGTTIFTQIDDKDQQGSIVFSEIAAGRIRNIREYVHPGKKIVCKVLKILPDHVELSFRRVTGAEREEILQRHKNIKTFENMLKAATKDPKSIIEKISQQYELWDFYEQIKESPQLLEKFLKKSESESLIKLLTDKKEKEKIVKKCITVKSLAENGIEEIRYILDIKNATIRYLGSSRFSVESKAKDFKEAEHSVNEILNKIEILAKERKIIFEVKDK